MPGQHKSIEPFNCTTCGEQLGVIGVTYHPDTDITIERYSSPWSKCITCSTDVQVSELNLKLIRTGRIEPWQVR